MLGSGRLYCFNDIVAASVLDLLGRFLLLRLPLEFVLNLDGQSHFNHLVPTLFGHSELNVSWNQDKLVTKGAARHFQIGIVRGVGVGTLPDSMVPSMLRAPPWCKHWKPSSGG